MTPNEKICDILRFLLTEIETGESAKSLEEGITTTFLILSHLFEEAGANVIHTLGSLELTKAQVLHRWNAIITKRKMGEGK